MQAELQLIKEKYGEAFAHLCRNFFPSILEKEGTLFSLLSKKFAYNKFLYEDIINNKQVDNFKNYIFSFFYAKPELPVTNKTPFELMDEAGYILTECKCEEDIQAFKKYYLPEEQLCTFRGGRLDSCHVFFAVKKDVDKIKRSDFKNPKREDKYGTSVISIQFSRGKMNNLSIKNRYNHIVDNPDATFSNNLEKIIPGLTNSFQKNYHLNIRNINQSNFELYSYVLANDGKYYKYNIEVNDVYFCLNNIIIDHGKVITDYTDKSRYIVMDDYIVDMHEKKIINYFSKEDGLTKELECIEKIIVTKNSDKTKNICIKYANGCANITLSVINSIIKYQNLNQDIIDDCFMMNNRDLKEIEIPNAKKIGHYFLCYNHTLSEINCPNTIEIGNYFLYSNISLKNISLPRVRKIGSNFIIRNLFVQKISLPEVALIGDNFMEHSISISEISMPKLCLVGTNFLKRARGLEIVSLPSLVTIGSHFLEDNEFIYSIDLPKAVYIADYFLSKNIMLEHLNLPKVQKIGNYFMLINNATTSFSAPKLVSVGSNFFSMNKVLKDVDMGSLEKCSYNFLKNVDINNLDEHLQQLVLDQALNDRSLKLLSKIFKKKK